MIVLFLLSAALMLPAIGARADTFPPGYPKMGDDDEAIAGHSLATDDGPIRSTLFPLYIDDEGEIGQYAYCVELAVSAHYDIDLDIGGWDDFPGDNNFASDPEVRERVAWIIHESYPFLSLEQFSDRSGVADITTEDAIAGTQAAIWSLTDSAPADSNYEYQGLHNNGVDTDSPEAERVEAVVDYLLSEANTGRPETITPSLAASASDDVQEAGALIGPITFDSSEDVLAVSTSSEYPLVDADGEPVDPDNVAADTEIYVDVPADAPAGSATIEAEAAGAEHTGLLVTNTDPRTQTLMIARSDQARVHDSATVEWAAIPSIATSAREGDLGGHVLPEGARTVIDTVSYEGLIPDREYQLEGELMVQDGEEPVASGITESRSFVPTEPSGEVELTFEVPADKLTGEVAVVFEHLFLDEVEVAAHADIDDEQQTVYRPGIDTDAYDLLDHDQLLDPAGATLRDDVSYSGLQPDEDYILRGEVINHATGDSTQITGETEFTPEDSSGIVAVDFDVPQGHAGQTLVVFEQLYVVTDDADDADDTDDSSSGAAVAGRGEQLLGDPADAPADGELLVATHADLDDKRQTVVVEEEPPPPPEEPSTPPAEPSTPPEEPSSPGPAPATGALSPESAPALPETGSHGLGSGVWISAVLVLTGGVCHAAYRRRHQWL